MSESLFNVTQTWWYPETSRHIIKTLSLPLSLVKDILSQKITRDPMSQSTENWWQPSFSCFSVLFLSFFFFNPKQCSVDLAGHAERGRSWIQNNRATWVLHSSSRIRTSNCTLDNFSRQLWRWGGNFCSHAHSDTTCNRKYSRTPQKLNTCFHFVKNVANEYDTWPPK